MKVQKIIEVGCINASNFEGLATKLVPHVDPKALNAAGTETTRKFVSSVLAIGSRHTRNKYLMYGFAAGVITTSAVVVVRKVKKAKKCGL